MSKYCLLCFFMALNSFAQSPFLRYDDPVPSAVELTYKKGLRYLAKTQSSTGNWGDSYGSMTGVVGLAVLAFLAHGEDPNFGPYASNIKRAISYILSKQSSTGYIGTSMYNHGFATLALAEAYGVVDDERLGKALKQAINLILNAQKNNPQGAWRYRPESTSADTTVSGACLVALLAARNAGLEIPESAIKKALNFYKICQADNGGIGYTSASGGNAARTAIACLAFQLSKKRQSPVYKNALKFLREDKTRGGSYYRFYFLYYASQTFFHSSTVNGEKLWQQFNEENIKFLKSNQHPDGSWTGSHGPAFSTASALLSLALNYRFLPIYER